MSTKASDREKRRAAALRQNLKRRKAAARVRSAPTHSGMPLAGREDVQDRPNTAKKPL